ncbi:MAG: molecular chaperone TorD family protein [Propionibacteriaceae bacterium]|nr:molecular chaperone TorD family protein [Propionibacteriaceae bacterium]
MTAVSASDTAEWLDEVAAAATFLSHALLRRDAAPSLVAEIGASGLADSWPLTGDAHRTGARLLAQAVNDPEDAATLNADFDALFLGPGRMHACPFESVYRSLEGLTFDAETMQVRRFYADHGLQAPAFNREPDDHVGLEVAFIGQLCLAALNALEDGEDDRAAHFISSARLFVGQHLGVWGPDFCTRVIEHSQTLFYAAVGHLLLSLLGEFPSRQGDMLTLQEVTVEGA